MRNKKQIDKLDTYYIATYLKVCLPEGYCDISIFHRYSTSI